MTKDKALKLAREALEKFRYHVANNYEINAAIAAAREALAQPEQEPVGVVESALRFAGGFHVKLFRDATMPDVGSLIYTTPPQPKELEATEHQVEVLSDDLSKCSKALKLALEALEDTCFNSAARVRTASKIIKEALAQPEQEPVAKVSKRYVNNIDWLNQVPEFDTLLYTTPPQRTWVGLTDEERKNIMIECESTGDWAWELKAAQAIEAKLKQKNT